MTATQDQPTNGEESGAKQISVGSHHVRPKDVTSSQKKMCMKKGGLERGEKGLSVGLLRGQKENLYAFYFKIRRMKHASTSFDWASLLQSSVAFETKGYLYWRQDIACCSNGRMVARDGDDDDDDDDGDNNQSTEGAEPLERERT